MWTGESKKRPTVSLRGRSKEEDRGEFLRRARVRQCVGTVVQIAFDCCLGLHHSRYHSTSSTENMLKIEARCQLGE